MSPKSWPETLLNIGSKTRVVIQPLNHKFTLNYDRVYFSWGEVCSYHGSIYLLSFFLSTVKAHTDLRKIVLSRVIIPGRIMTRVFNQCWIFTPGHNSTWNYDPSCEIRRLGIVRIQQLDQFPRQHGPQFNKNPLNMDSGSIFNWGPNLSYTSI